MPSVEVDEQTYTVLLGTAQRRGTDPAEVIRYLLGLSAQPSAATTCQPRRSVEDADPRPA